MRRKPSSHQGGGYNNNQQRKPRFPQSGGGNGGDHRGGGHQHNRPRKNYAAAREKYLAQARDALASGDRVLAENYYQHADHCYRMMVEEGYQVRNSYAPSAPGEEQAPQAATAPQDEQLPANNNQLPAFLTESYEQSEPKAAEIPVVQNWEERDA